MNNIIARLLLLCMMVLSLNFLSLNTMVAAEDQTGTEDESDTMEKPDSDLAPENRQTQEERDKDRKESLIRFIPSEDIEAANAVAFPVDI